MKKLLILIAGMVFVLNIALTVNAASIGGVETQGKGKLSMALDSSFIYDRDYKWKSAENISAGEEVKDGDISRGWQAFLKTSYGLLDNLDVYVKIGMADYKLNTIFNDTLDLYSFPFRMNSDSDFAYGLGLKGKYEFVKNWLIGYDLQYLRSKQDVKITKIKTTCEPTGVFKSTVFQDWHAALYLGRKLKNFTPYLGVRYSDARIKTKELADESVWLPSEPWIHNIKFEAEYNVGVFLGTDYNITKNLSINLEGRFIDETAISTAVQYKF